VAALTQDHKDEIVQAAGIRTQVRRGGKGAPLLYIHGELGLPGWIHALDLLASERDVTAPSLPGYGASERPDWIMSIHDLAAWVVWFVRDLKLSTPIDVVASSMGGWIAAEIARVNPSMIRKLVLVGPMGLKPREGEIFDYFLEGGMTGIKRNFHAPENSAEFKRHWGRELTQDETDAIEWHRETTCRIVWKPYMHSLTLQHFLPSISVPTLVLQGLEDAITPADCGELYRQGIPNAKLERLPDCGHLPEFECPEKFASSVLGYLK
jgi:pimeloyl-ACP methyl ester carboxylesterase